MALLHNQLATFVQVSTYGFLPTITYVALFWHSKKKKCAREGTFWNPKMKKNMPGRELVATSNLDRWRAIVTISGDGLFHEVFSLYEVFNDCSCSHCRCWMVFSSGTTGWRRASFLLGWSLVAPATASPGDSWPSRLPWVCSFQYLIWISWVIG